MFITNYIHQNFLEPLNGLTVRCTVGMVHDARIVLNYVARKDGKYVSVG